MTDRQLIFIKQLLQRGIDVHLSQFPTEVVKDIETEMKRQFQLSVFGKKLKDSLYCLHAEAFVVGPVHYVLDGYADWEGGVFRSLYIGDNCVLSCMEGIAYYNSTDQTAKDLFNGADSNYSAFLNYTRELYDPKLITLRQIMKNVKNFTYQVSFGKPNKTTETPLETPIAGEDRPNSESAAIVTKVFPPFRTEPKKEKLIVLFIDGEQRMYRFNGKIFSRVRIQETMLLRYIKAKEINTEDFSKVKEAFIAQYGKCSDDFAYVPLEEIQRRW